VSAYIENLNLMIIARKDSSGVYLVSYTGTKTGRVIFQVKDEQGTTMVTRTIHNTKDFQIPINFSSVAEGKYIVQIDNGSDTRTETVNYSNATAPTYSRITNLGDKKFLLMASHIGSEKISIRITDDTGSILYDKEKIIKGDFAMLFNLKGIHGEPTFEITEKSGNSIMVPGHPLVVDVKK
jgi:hypothetical protein